MHGQFYSNQHYAQRSGVPQNPSSGVANQAPDILHQPRLQFSNQHAEMMNGQTFRTRNAEQPQQQQRRQQMQHPAGQLTHQQYAQLLQNQNYQALYNQAFHQQNQTLQTNRQQGQQRLLQQQQNAANDQSTSFRALLANQYPREALNQMHQHMTLNQLGLWQSSVPSSHLATNLQHQQAAAKATTSIPHYQDELRKFSHILEQRALQDQTHPQGLQHLRNLQPAQSSTPQAVHNQHQDLINMAHHISPITPVPSPVLEYTQNPNLYPNILVPPQGISPHRNVFSPALGHLANMGASMVPTTSVQMVSRADVSAVIAQVQAHPMQGNYGVMQNQTVTQELQSPTRIRAATPSGNMAIIHVKRQTPSVNSSVNFSSAPVIIDLVSDDDEEEQQPSTSRKSGKSESKERSLLPAEYTRVVIDDDLEITGVMVTEIMSHMRPDCPIHPFHRVDNVNIGPQSLNSLKCKKCYCYVCDKLANECGKWATPDKPHCNAHSRASCWKARRNTKRSPLMMRLSADEITPEMAEAGELAMQYIIQIREMYITYRNGIPCEYESVPCNCQCHVPPLPPGGQEPCISCKAIHDVKKRFNYQPVRESALRTIAEIQSTYSRCRPVISLIMLEAVFSELCSQRPADFNHQLRIPSNPDPRCQCDFPKILEDHIEKELLDIFFRHEIKTSFRNHFIKCVEEAIKPLQLTDLMKKFLNMRHWDNLLLRAVLTGSNISGSKGREVLRETADVVKMRVEKLDEDKRYQSILRYLKTVKILQCPKSTISNNEIMVLKDQWILAYTAKQGHFKDVVLRLTEPVISDQSVRASLVLSTFQPDFLIQLLDALAGKDAQPTTKLGSFDPNNSHGPHVIVGKDADVLILLFHYIVQQNQFATAHIPLYLWLAKWVNRTPLSPCLDPNRIQPWTDQGTAIMDNAMRAFRQGQCQSFLLQCSVQDPHVHLFNASINIINVVSKFQNAFTAEHLDSIMDAYKNNEWGLFILLTQSPMMNLRNVNVLRWITKFCETNNGLLAQIKDRVIIESIQPYHLDDVSEFLKSLIKPDWVNSVESIQRTALAVTSEYSLRLLEEMKRCDLQALAPKAKWLEDVVLKYVEEQRISANLLREEVTANYVKNVVKICSYLNPIKRNIELYRRNCPSAEWIRRCSTLIEFLAKKFTKECFSGTMDEFSTLLWLLWTISDLERMDSYFIYFQERHLCSTDRSKVTTSKVTEEVASLLDSAPNPETIDNKRSMVERCRRLCVLQTLSWLTCTDCATKMSTEWTRIWISIANSKLDDCVRSLNHAMLEQFKMWLNNISFNSPDSYKRLLGCLRLFLNTLISTWHRCSISYKEAGCLMIDVAEAVVHLKLRRDIISISNGIIQAELDKLKPKTPEVPPEQRPSNHLGTTRPSSGIPTSAKALSSVTEQRPSNHLGTRRPSNALPTSAAPSSSVSEQRPSNHLGTRRPSNALPISATPSTSVLEQRPSNHLGTRRPLNNLPASTAPSSNVSEQRPSNHLGTRRPSNALPISATPSTSVSEQRPSNHLGTRRPLNNLPASTAPSSNVSEQRPSNHLGTRRPSNALPISATPSNSVLEQRPSNHLGTRRPSNNLPASTAPSSGTISRHKPQHVTQALAVSVARENPAPHGVPKESKQTQKPPEKNVVKSSDVTPQRRTEIPTKPHAVMATDSLFRKKTQNSGSNPPKPVPEKQKLTPNSPKKDQTPFSTINLTRTKDCQNCGATISRASFSCPKCNQSTRSVKPVTCPQCHQENRHLKGYSCQFCYSSLLDVLLGGGERPQVVTDDIKEKLQQKKKKKRAEKRKKKKARLAAKNNMAATMKTVAASSEIETQKPALQPKTDGAKRLSPLMVKISNKKSTNLSEDSPDSSLEDFTMEKAPQKHKRRSDSVKVATIKLKKKPSNPPSHPPHVSRSTHGASLTDSDSDAEDKTALIISPEENSEISEKLKYSPVRPNSDQFLDRIPIKRVSQERNALATSKTVMPRQQPSNSLNKAPVVSLENVSVTHNPIPDTHNSIPATHNPPLKRGMGHSSVMSKKQKNILSRLKKPGAGAPKFPTPTKTPPANSRPPNKEILKPPSTGSQKRLPLDNGCMSSPGRGQVNERQRHDSSCSSGSVGSSSGLSFGLAKVGEKRCAKNVGHRTGGPPGSAKKIKLDRKASRSNTPSNVVKVKRTLVPQPLNRSESVGNHGKKNEKKLTAKMPMVPTSRTLEQRLISILARRKPGPASRSNYRKILKIEHKLKKLQRPHRGWRLPSSVKIPAKVDLTRYPYVSLCTFPRDRLLRIQKLVPCDRLKVLYA